MSWLEVLVEGGEFIAEHASQIVETVSDIGSSIVEGVKDIFSSGEAAYESIAPDSNFQIGDISVAESDLGESISNHVEFDSIDGSDILDMQEMNLLNSGGNEAPSTIDAIRRGASSTYDKIIDISTNITSSDAFKKTAKFVAAGTTATGIFQSGEALYKVSKKWTGKTKKEATDYEQYLETLMTENPSVLAMDRASRQVYNEIVHGAAVKQNYSKDPLTLLKNPEYQKEIAAVRAGYIQENQLKHDEHKEQYEQSRNLHISNDSHPLPFTPMSFNHKTLGGSDLGSSMGSTQGTYIDRYI